MKYLVPAVVVALFISLGFLSPAFASVTPTLTLAATGSGDTVQINVTGDPDVSVGLSYTQSNSIQTISLGSTDSNGYFSTTLSSGTYGLIAGTLVTAVLDGTGGPQSSPVAWPISTLGLSQNAVVLDAGSSITVTATNASSGALYVPSNSNPSVADESISGNGITIEGVVPGTTTMTVCEDSNSAPCPILYIMVAQENASQLSFSLNNVSVTSGQTLPITILGGNGSYEIIRNSNANIIPASISGSVLNLTATAAIGSSSILVCSTDMSACGVVVASAGTVNTSTITLSSTSPIIPVGQNTSISISSPSTEQFSISSNSNPGVVQATLSGSVLNLAGLTGGSSSITVCASGTSNNCASLTATVPSSTTSSTISSSSFGMSESSVSLATGTTASVSLTGDGNYSVPSNSNPSVASVSVSGSIVTITGMTPGSTTATICEDTNTCLVLSVIVDTASTQTTTTQVSSTPAAVPTSAAPPSATFTEYLAPGASGAQVTALQKILASEGFFAGSATGYYGTETENAVIKFQAAHDINQLGVVGPATRAALNEIVATGSVSTSTTTTPIADMTLGQLQAQVQSLQAQLTQVLNRISQLQ